MLPKALLALAFPLAATAAWADHAFLLPSTFTLAGARGTVTVDAASSDNLFQFDHRPLPLEQVKVWRPDGGEAPAPTGTRSRFRSSFDLALDAPGTWKIGMVTTTVVGTAMIDGQERRVTTMRFGPGPGGPGSGGLGGAEGRRDGPGREGGGERRPDGPGAAPATAGPPRLPPIQLAELPAGATDLKLTEMLARNETFVTLGAPTTGVFAGDARGITLRPVTHPSDLVANEPARFRFLIDGKPAAGLAVAIVADGQRFRDNEAAIALKADAQGVVTIRWPAPGRYWLNATAEDGNPVEKRAAVRRMSYVATLEVAAP